MFDLESLTLKIKRGEGPIFGAANKLAKSVMNFHIPDSGITRTMARAAYVGHVTGREISERCKGLLWAEPLFKSRCEQVGENLFVERVPYIQGHGKIFIGDNVSFSGNVMITSGRFCDEPKLIIGDNVFIGHGTTFSVNQFIELGDYSSIAGNVRIADNDGHPSEWERRAAKDDLTEDEIRPVRIGKHAWIGSGAQILKGVTIGDRAIIGAGSVVISDVPADAMAMGAPARVVRAKTK